MILPCNKIFFKQLPGGRCFPHCQRAVRGCQATGQRKEPKLRDRFQDCSPNLCHGASTCASLYIALGAMHGTQYLLGSKANQRKPNS